MAIKFSTKDQSKTPPAKAGKPAPAIDEKTSTADAAGSDADLFEAETVKPAARGRKKK
ncbi:hypothetical protein [Mesorhizobium sp. A623]